MLFSLCCFITYKDPRRWKQAALSEGFRKAGCDVVTHKNTHSREEESPEDSISYAFKCFLWSFYGFFTVTHKLTAFSHKTSLLADRQLTHIHTLTLPAPPSPIHCGLSRHKESSCVFLVLTLAQDVCRILDYFYLPHFPS